jgi:hypothetical protein
VAGPTDESEATLLDHYTGKQPYSVPTWYVGLSSTTPTDAGGSFTEPSAGGYQRVALTAASWTAATGGDPSSTSYGATLSFPVSTGGWGGLSHFGLFSQSTGGTVQAWGTLSSALTVGTGDRPVFAANSLRVRLGDPPDFLAPAGGFAPTDIAGLMGWYDPSDTSSITETAGAVSQLDDLSGNGRHLVQATGSNQPITGTRTQNGLNVLDFDGSGIGQRLYYGTNVAYNPYTIYLVAMSDTSAQGQTGTGAPNGAGDFLRVFSTLYQANVNGNNGSFGISPTTVVILGLLAEDGSQERRANGASAGSTTINPVAGVTRLGLGARQDGGFAGWEGWLAEYIVYDSKLSSTDRDDVETYLNDKWAVY